MQGLQSGSDRQIPLPRILRRKVPRGDTEKDRGSRRKDKKGFFTEFRGE